MDHTPTKIERLRALTPEVAEAMRASFNGEPVENVRECVASGKYGLVRATLNNHAAHCIVSRTGEMVCLEAVEGNGFLGLHLARFIVSAARDAGLQCEGWTFKSNARLRLWARVGFNPTGETRISGSGLEQLRLRA